MSQLRTILHADMDCFFTAVEVLDDPTLAGKPLVVGGSPQGRGVVASASYEAREFGIRSAMPMARAVRLCPQLVRRRGRFERYRELSQQVFAIFRHYTPEVEPISIDEAFLDVTNSRQLFGDGAAIARAIRQEVRDSTGLVVSIGVAPNKFVAKLASPMNKPDGLTVAPFEAEALVAWLADVPIGKMWGIGKATEPKLRRLGIRTFGDLQRMSVEVCRQWLGDHGLSWRERAFGRDSRPVKATRDPAKSISHETTFEVDVADRERLRATVSQLAEKVAARARKHGYVGSCVVLKARFHDFTTITRQQALDAPTQADDPVFRTAWQLFEQHVPADAKLRLVGVVLTNLAAAHSKQRTLFAQLSEAPTEEAGATTQQQQQALDAMLDAVRNQLGPQAIQRGRDLPGNRKR